MTSKSLNSSNNRPFKNGSIVSKQKYGFSFENLDSCTAPKLNVMRCGSPTPCNSQTDFEFYGQTNNTEIQIRYLPPAVPYPPKEFIPGIFSKVPDSIPEECICREPPEDPPWTSRYCLEKIRNILNRLDLEFVGEKVFSTWDIYLRKSPSGLGITDSDLMAEIILELSTHFPRLEYSCEFMEIVGLHLKKGICIKTSGGALEFKRLAYCLSILGQSICGGYQYTQHVILEILMNWIDRARDGNVCVTKNKKCPTLKSAKVSSIPVKTMPLPNHVFMTALELSQLPRILAECVINGPYTNAYCEAMHVLRRCCDISTAIRTKIQKLPLLDPLLLKLCLEDCSNNILGRTIELIYSLLGEIKVGEDPDKHDFITLCPESGTFQILLDRFFQQITQFTSKLLLNLRNDTAFVICLLVKYMPALKDKFGKYAAEICDLVMKNISDESSCIQIPYIIDSTCEDAEFLKFLIWMLQLMVETGSENVQKLILEHRLVSVLLRVLIGPSRLIDEIRAISPTDQLESIAWSTLTAIAKTEPKAFLHQNGVPMIINYLNNYNETGEADLKTLSMFTHLLRTILSHDNPKSTKELVKEKEIISYFLKLDTIQILIQTIKTLTTTNFTKVEEPILCNLLLSCAALAQYDQKEKDSFNDSLGVKVITRLIRQLIYHPAHERHMDTLLQISLAECILRCIADSPSSLETFLGHEGLFRFLDLLELSAGPAASLHIINSILELCEYPRCMDQLMYWKRPLNNLTQRLAYGDGFNIPGSRVPGALKPMNAEVLGDVNCDHDQTLSAMLCDIWRDEEKRLGVLRDEDGCIASMKHPLMSKFARDYQSGRMPSKYVGPSSLDMIGSVRPKIFLLVKKITEWVNTEAQVFDGLSLSNQVTMQIIINFLDLKRCEMWHELMVELKEDHFKFVSTDESVMEIMVKVAGNKVSALIETQRYLINRSLEKEEIHEREFYNLLKKCHMQDHLKAVREAQYLAKTSDYTYLVERRLWQKIQLQNAVVKPASHFRLHRTTNGPLNITVWPGRTKIIISEPTSKKLITENEPDQFIPSGSIDELEAKSKHFKESSSMYSSKSNSQNGSLFSSRIGSIMVEDPNNVSRMTVIDDGGATPRSSEEGLYQVVPEVLKKALLQVLAAKSKLGWLSTVDDENYWKVRTKWKKDWYPERQIKINYSLMRL